MKTSLKLLSLLISLLLTLALAGCHSTPQEAHQGGNHTVSGIAINTESADPVNDVNTSFAQNSEDMFTDRDTRTSYDGGTIITLSGTSASAAADGVSINGSTVTITADGTYILRGTLENGSLIVNAPSSAKLQLVLDGVSIHNARGAALCILGGDKVFITLAKDRENSLTSGDRFAAIGEENVDGALYSKQDLTLNGEGSLTITSPAGHGIVGKDDVVITGGSYTLRAAEHGIDANDSVRIREAALSVTAGKDGVHVENTDDATRGYFYMESGALTLHADGDGVDAGFYIQIENGALSITAGGGAQKAPRSATTGESTSSTKGIKAAGSILISGGTITVDSADDAIHANTSAVIRAGTLTLSCGDDGVHADQYLTVSGGTLVVSKSYEGFEAQDVEICGGDITLHCTDDGINAAGGTDGSGSGGPFGGDTFGGRGGSGPHGAPGGPGGMRAGNGSVLISGGSLYIGASSDGIDANGSLTILGGLVTVCGPTKGDTAVLDFDTAASIRGGTFIGTGAQGMAMTFTESEQGVISLRVGNQAAGTVITLIDAQGDVLISYEPALSYALVILSTPQLVKGESYTVTVGEHSEVFTAQ